VVEHFLGCSLQYKPNECGIQEEAKRRANPGIQFIGELKVGIEVIHEN
jgi:hypothetical protein